jgi:hypothetical protein
MVRRKRKPTASMKLLAISQPAAISGKSEIRPLRVPSTPNMQIRENFIE